jgi:hypothetical protein
MPREPPVTSAVFPERAAIFTLPPVRRFNANGVVG